MAKKTKNGNGNGKKSEEQYQAPDGFNINVGRDRGEGWIKKVEGNVVQGRLMSRTEYKNKRGQTRAFYQIKLSSKCQIQIENPDFNEEADEDDLNTTMIDSQGEPGMTVNVDEFKKLEDLKAFTRDGGIYDVWFVMGGKIDLGGDQTMWTLLAGPRVAIVQAPSQESRSSGRRYDEGKNF